MKAEMMRHRSRLWRTFLCCIGPTGPALAVLLFSNDEGGAAIIIPGSVRSEQRQMLHCCDENPLLWRNWTKLRTRRHDFSLQTNQHIHVRMNTKYYKHKFWNKYFQWVILIRFRCTIIKVQYLLMLFFQQADHISISGILENSDSILKTYTKA